MGSLNLSFGTIDRDVDDENDGSSNSEENHACAPSLI